MTGRTAWKVQVEQVADALQRGHAALDSRASTQGQEGLQHHTSFSTSGYSTSARKCPNQAGVFNLIVQMTVSDLSWLPVAGNDGEFAS